MCDAVASPTRRGRRFFAELGVSSRDAPRRASALEAPGQLEATTRRARRCDCCNRARTSRLLARESDASARSPSRCRPTRGEFASEEILSARPAICAKPPPRSSPNSAGSMKPGSISSSPNRCPSTDSALPSWTVSARLPPNMSNESAGGTPLTPSTPARHAPTFARREAQVNKVNTKAAGIVGLAVMCSRVLGLVREQIFAWLFGGGKRDGRVHRRLPHAESAARSLRRRRALDGLRHRLLQEDRDRGRRRRPGGWRTRWPRSSRSS